MKYKNLHLKFASLLRFGMLAALLSFSLLWSSEVHASHAAGATLTYGCLGNNQYQVQLQYINDCSGISFPNNATITFTSASCGLTFSETFTVDDPNGTPAIAYCDDYLDDYNNLTPCPGPNGTGTTPGQLLFTYTGVITLPANCNDWVASWSINARNSDNTNLISPGSNNLYVETTIDNSDPTLCNNSVQFTGAQPVVVVCSGEQFSYTPAASDPDGDSLRFTLIAPLGNAGNPMNFQLGLNANQPIAIEPGTNFAFNPNTGQITCTPVSGQAQLVTITILVEEIRNGVVIASTIRDIQIVIRNGSCSSAVQAGTPTIDLGGVYFPDSIYLDSNTLDLSSGTYIVCDGDTLIFTIGVSDPDGDSISFDIRNTNLDAVFGPGNFNTFPNYPLQGMGRYDTLTLTVIVYEASLGVSTFNIGFTDGQCPSPGRRIVSGNVLVPGVEITASDTAICPGVAQTIQLEAETYTTTGVVVGGSFLWTQVSGPAAPLSSTTSRNPTAQIPATTIVGDQIRYTVEYTTPRDPFTGATCITTDTVVISFVDFPLDVNLSADRISLCPNNLNDTINYSTTVFGPNVNTTAGTFSWVSGTNLGNIDDVTAGNTFGIHAGEMGDSLNYTIQYDYGLCSGQGNLTVYFDRATLEVDGDTAFCAGDSIPLWATYNSVYKLADDFSCGVGDYNCDGPTRIDRIGTGTSTTDAAGSTPFGGATTKRRTQYLFRAAELRAAGIEAGLIHDLTFFVAGLKSITPYEDFTIKMGCTGVNSFTSSTPFESSTQEVFTTASYRPVLGANTFMFDKTFAWDGSSNVIVEICYNNSVVADNDEVVANLSVPFNATRYAYGNAIASPCGANASAFTTDGSNNDRPHMEFTSCRAETGYTYNWLPIPGIGRTDTSDVKVSPNTPTTYIVTATDGSCLLTDSVSVTLLPSLDTPDISCGVTAFPNNSVRFEWGGVASASGWEYSLDSGRTWVQVGLADSSLFVDNLIAGQTVGIHVRASGSNGGACPTNAASYWECTTVLCQPTLNIDQVADVSCFNGTDGAVTITATGGNGGAPYGFFVYDTSGTLITTDTTRGTAVLGGLPANDYYVVVLDSVKCIDTTAVFTVNMPTELVASIDSSYLTTCFNSADGQLHPAITGGTPGYTFAWSNGGTDSLLTNVAIGNYTLTVTDARGCQDQITGGVYSQYAQAPALNISTTDATLCFPVGNGEAVVQSVTSLSGTPVQGQPNSMTFDWTDINGNPIPGSTSATGLIPGQYIVTVTDGAGVCSISDTITINGPSIAIASTTIVNTDCNQDNGEATVIPVGNPSDFVWTWDAATGNQTTSTAINLAGGTYVVTITDNNSGCSDTSSVEVLSASLSISLDVANSVRQLDCKGDNDGVLDIIPTRTGAGTLSFNWSTGGTSEDLTGLTSGYYSVTATLNGPVGCQVSLDSIFIDEPDSALVVDLVQTKVAVCERPNDNTLRAVAKAGSGGYTYSWSHGETGFEVYNLSTGQYKVTVTDLKGCTAVDSADVMSAFVPSLDAWIQTMGNTSTTVFAGTPVTIDAGFDESNNNVTYAWTPVTGVANSTAANTSVNTNTVVGTETDPVSIEYVVTATGPGPDFCVVMDTVTLVVDPVGFKGMPDVFTPTESENNLFRPVGLIGATVERFEIYNRFGQLIYDDATYGNGNGGWNGTYEGEEQPRDVYIYVLEYKFPADASTTVLRGEVLLIR